MPNGRARIAHRAAALILAKVARSAQFAAQAVQGLRALERNAERAYGIDGVRIASPIVRTAAGVRLGLIGVMPTCASLRGGPRHARKPSAEQCSRE